MSLYPPLRLTITSIILFSSIPNFGDCGRVWKRQAPVPGGSRPPPNFPSGDLLPPVALSASFPTLRPRSPNNAARAEQPPRDLVPPPLNTPGVAGGAGGSNPVVPNITPFQASGTSSGSTSPEFALLPPLEIPPEKPLTDAEILQTIQGVRDTSFIPTTGQGVPASRGNANADQISLSLPQPSTRLPVPTNSTGKTVRFPGESSGNNVVGESKPLLQNCPACDCTSQVDYICASNGVLYLNSCSFDCATFCDSRLTKVPLEFCESHNNNTTK